MYLLGIEDNDMKTNIEKQFAKIAKSNDLGVDANGDDAGNESILWDRTFGEEDIEKSKELVLENKLNEILDAYNKKNGLEHTGDKASHIAIGHTVQNAGINSICNKRVWRTDSAMSKAFGDNSNEPNRKPQVLEILDNGKITHLIL